MIAGGIRCRATARKRANFSPQDYISSSSFVSSPLDWGAFRLGPLPTVFPTTASTFSAVDGDFSILMCVSMKTSKALLNGINIFLASWGPVLSS